LLFKRNFIKRKKWVMEGHGQWPIVSNPDILGNSITHIKKLDRIFFQVLPKKQAGVLMRVES
jgi:hypothetical protein